MEIIAYLYASYLAARHLARRVGSEDWLTYFPIGLAWPFFPLAWLAGKLSGSGRSSSQPR